MLGLVMSDENPLFEDENENGIDDRFERQRRAGTLLARNSPAVLRSALARDWMADQRATPPPALILPQPQPDGVDN